MISKSRSKGKAPCHACDVYTNNAYTWLRITESSSGTKRTLDISRHRITPREIEEVFGRIYAEVITDPVNGEARYRALGTTANDRHLTIAYTERGEYIRPITGWNMTPEELEIYVEEIFRQLDFRE